MVKGIFVRDGQAVKAGDVLIELDPTISSADVTHLRNDLLAAKLDVARLHSSLIEEGDPMATFDPPMAPIRRCSTCSAGCWRTSSSSRSPSSRRSTGSAPEGGRADHHWRGNRETGYDDPYIASASRSGSR